MRVPGGVMRVKRPGASRSRGHLIRAQDGVPMSRFDARALSPRVFDPAVWWYD